MSTIAVGVSEKIRMIGPKRLRWTKLAGAVAVAALVGIASYAAMYHLLVLLSAPPAA